MSQRKRPRVSTDTPIGPDVDLETEHIHLPSGTRLTQEVADEIVERVRSSPGRPSLSGTPRPSPQIAFRVPAKVRDRAAKIAAKEGKTISELAREALEERISRPAS